MGTPAFVQRAFTNMDPINPVPSGGFVATLPVTATAGNLLIACYRGFNFTTVSVPAGFTEAPNSPLSAKTADIGIRVFTKISVGTETSISFTPTANNFRGASMSIDEYSGAQVGSTTFSATNSNWTTTSTVLGPTDAPIGSTSIPLFIVQKVNPDSSIAISSPWTGTFAGLSGSSVGACSGVFTQPAPNAAVSATLTRSGTTSETYPTWFNMWLDPSTSSGITVALTGQSATTGAGSGAPVQASSLSGQQASSGQGVAAAAVSAGLSGAPSTLAFGSTAPSSGVALGGLAATTAIGTLTAVSAGVNIALTGNALAASAGAMHPAGAVTVAGQALVSSTGVMVAQSAGITLPLAGEAFSASAGTLAPQQSLALTGLASGVTAGTMTAFAGQNVTVAIAGIGLAAAAGTVAAGNTVALTGQRVQAAVGSLATFADLALASHPIVFLPGSLNPRAGILVTEPGRTALFPAELRIATFPAEQRTARFVV
jgi:hypothetical protein